VHYRFSIKPTTTQVFAVGHCGNLIALLIQGSSYYSTPFGKFGNNLMRQDFKTDRLDSYSGEERRTFLLPGNSALLLIRRPISEAIKIVSI